MSPRVQAQPRGGAERAGQAAPHKGETPKVRGEHTRRRIAEAAIALMCEQDSPPTAKEVASRSGVSVRLVFHHFEDMGALNRVAAEVQLERHWRPVRAVPPDLPLARRIERTVQQRAKLFDSIGPVRRAAVMIARRDALVAQGLEDTNVMLRDWIEATFSPELGSSGAARRELLSALDAAASWETWDRLRRFQNLSSTAARRVVARMLHALVAG